MSRETIHLLLLTHTQNEAESIVSLLRNSGSATRAHYVQSIDDFNTQLQEKSWDLALSFAEANGINYTDLLRSIQRANTDLPLVLLCNEVNANLMEKTIRSGARTIVPIDEPNLLLLVIQREIDALQARRDVRNLEVQLRDAEKRCQSLLESSRDAIAYIHDGMHVFANKIYLDLFGYQNTDELEGIPIMDMIESSSQKEFKQQLKMVQQDDSQVHRLNTTGINGKKQPFAMIMQFSPAIYAEEECTQVSIELNNNNSELEAKIKAMGNLDQLTGLYNKPYLMARLEEAVNRAVRKGARSGLLYINIDHFGQVIGDIGLHQADLVLIEIAKKISNLLPEQAVLARLGGDIFCCLCPGFDTDQSMQMAETIRHSIAEFLIAIDKRTITVTASIGVTVLTENNSRPDEILQQAHNAAYSGKPNAARGNSVCMFVRETPDLDNASEDTEKFLAEAIKNNQFSLVFQPLISLQGEEAEHYEVYLRLIKADGSTSSAGEFFVNPNLSDEIKRKLDRWVILHTTKLLSEHQTKGHNTRIFVNISAASLNDESLVNWIAILLRRATLAKGSLIIQFHENDATVMLKQAQDFTQSLQEKGIPSAVSRFGCAINPMQALSHLAVTYAKIDGSFTQELGSIESQKQLKTLLDALHEEDKITIIPFVENAATMATLWQTGAHFLQGHGVQAPQAVMAFDFGDEQEI